MVISNHNARPGAVWYDDIVIENVIASKSNEGLTPECHVKWEKYADSDAFFRFGRDIACGTVTIRNVHRHQDHSTQSPLFAFKPPCSFDRLCIENVVQTTAPGVTAPIWVDEGAKIGHLIERDSVTEREK